MTTATVTPTTTSLTKAEAGRLTTRIELHLGMIADSTEKVLPLIEEARNGNAHEALGFKSWTLYVSEKFGDSLARLDKADRVPLVKLMSDQGMSTRAIAIIVGVSQATAAREARESNDSPDESVATSEVEVNKDVTSTNTSITGMDNTSITTGLDGKTYSRPERTAPRRRPLPDAYFAAAYDLEKVLARIKRLHDDDRFQDHREFLKQKHGSSISDADALLSSISGDLNDVANRCGDCEQRIPVNSEFLLKCDQCSAPGGAL